MALTPEQTTIATQMLKARVHPSVIRDVLGVDQRTLNGLARKYNLASDAKSVSRTNAPPAIRRQAALILKAKDFHSTYAILASLPSPEHTSLLLREIAQKVQSQDHEADPRSPADGDESR